MCAFIEFFRRPIPPLCLLILGLMQTPFGASGKSRSVIPPKPLDEVTLDTAYLGELMEERSYSTLIPYFEDLLQNRRYTGRIDSIFLLKSLGRMAITDSATREKGKAYLARAAYMNPGTAVWEVYDAQKKLDYAQIQAAPVAPTNPDPQPISNETSTHSKPNSWYRTPGLWWAVGAASTAVAAGVVTYLLLSESDRSSEQVESISIH